MWRRTYLVLLLVRIYFALSPSYLHPDEHFQGPEVFAGRIYSYPSQLTWEFTSERPIRSVFPLWLVYGMPMSLVRWFYEEMGYGSPPPALVYYALRAGMLVLSFVLEDWAIHELVSTPRHRVQTTVLVASSYVTWTYQTHTFSNSVETLLVAWGLVLIQRIIHNKKHSASLSCVVLSFVAVIGIFNRITFPAFLLIPGLQLLPHFVRKPFSLLCLVLSGSFFTAIAILTDTAFYRPAYSASQSIRHPIVTPLNNLFYNTDRANLATHGLHPHYQHFFVNLPQLLGPIYIVLIMSLFSRAKFSAHMANKRAISAISGTMILSIFPHQEPRFLIPCIPLLLTCVRVRKSRLFLATWIIFNALLGFLMGIYHQGGVVPAQLEIPSIVSATMADKVDVAVTSDVTGTAKVYWWKTYSPPLWLLGDNSTLPIEIHTHDLMGMPGSRMIEELEASIPNCHNDAKGKTRNRVNSTFLVAPRSATFLDRYRRLASISPHPSSPPNSATPLDSSQLPIDLQELWTYSKHLSLDDLDFGDDGILPTLKRVIGRRGLTVWEVRRPECIS